MLGEVGGDAQWKKRRTSDGARVFKPEMASKQFVFLGRFIPESFVDFMRHRAARLSLEAGFGFIDAERIEVRVGGAEDLIDMFEMACSLGPIDCLVVDIYRDAARL
jgi:hypothetical protein